ncbi:MAG: RHS repeat-associated core domain-containing protein [Candidatus Omnitrophota bacterium]
MIKGANSYYYSKDGLGSVINLTDSSGSVVEAYSYDEYGMPLSNPQHSNNRYLYTGREFDAETRLYYYRARYYDPAIGRFLQADPLGIDEENTYTYVNNNPINYIDPYGLWGIDFSIGLGRLMPPLGWKPFPDIHIPGRDVLPAPTLPPQEETNSNKRNKSKTKQLALSESIVHAATEGEKNIENKRSLGDIWKDFWEDLKGGWEHFKKIWEKINERMDPKQPKNGYSKRELWRNKKTGEEMWIHRLKEGGRTPEKHPHIWTP